jgi:hypothetical protein
MGDKSALMFDITLGRLDRSRGVRWCRQVTPRTSQVFLGIPEFIYAHATHIPQIRHIANCDMGRIGRYHCIDCNVKDNC